MESNAFFERKVALTPKDMNQVGIAGVTVDTILLKTVRDKLEDRCSEHGFVLPGTVKMLSRSMGGFEAARFTGEAVYYVKAEGRVLYPADGLRLTGEVIRKNKMGLYVTYRNALRIQVLRDLHLGNEEFDKTEVGDLVDVEIKKSFFQINDPYILANGLFVQNRGQVPSGMKQGPLVSGIATGAPKEDADADAGADADVDVGAAAGAGAGAGADMGLEGMEGMEGADLIEAAEEEEGDEQSE